MHSRKRFQHLCIIAALGFVLSGCATAPLPTNYAPSSVMSISGSLSVGEFEYLPATNGSVATNQIRNTALGSVKIDKDVNIFFRDALFSELRFAGATLDNSAQTLTGRIQEFLIDDFGYSIDWTLTVNYNLLKDDGSVAYQAQKITERRTSKFANLFGALNETVKLNAEELMKDPEFIRAINQ